MGVRTGTAQGGQEGVQETVARQDSQVQVDSVRSVNTRLVYPGASEPRKRVAAETATGKESRTPLKEPGPVGCVGWWSQRMILPSESIQRPMSIRQHGALENLALAAVPASGA